MQAELRRKNNRISELREKNKELEQQMGQKEAHDPTVEEVMLRVSFQATIFS